MYTYIYTFIHISICTYGQVYTNVYEERLISLNGGGSGLRSSGRLTPRGSDPQGGSSQAATSQLGALLKGWGRSYKPAYKRNSRVLLKGIV